MAILRMVAGGNFMAARGDRPSIHPTLRGNGLTGPFRRIAVLQFQLAG